MDMLLELKNIRLSFTNTRKEVFNLLDGVDLQVPEGKITALVGGNGSGKTTLFNIISGFQDGFSGEVLFNGRRIDGMPSHRIAKLGIGRLFQGRQLMGGLTLMENMKIADESEVGENPFSSIFVPKKVAKSEAAREEEAIGVLKSLFGEDNKYLGMLNHKASDLSYGEQRLIAIARLLMGDCKLLLLDEPTAGVNPVYIETIGEIIRRMVAEDGLTVLLIEHNMHFVRSLADTCAYLDDGKISKVGQTSEVLDDSRVRSSYLGL